MSGVEIGAAVAGFISLAFHSFQGCIQAFEFFYTAEHIGNDGEFILSSLDWEQYRLMEWARRAGLESAPNERLNWGIAGSTLKQLETLLTSAAELKKRYRLDVTEEIVEVEELRSRSPRQNSVGRIIAQLKPDISSATARVIQGNSNALKKFRWAAHDRDKAFRITRDIAELISRLDTLLDSVDQERLNLVLSALLRDIVSRSTTAAQIDVVKELMSASRPASHHAITAAATIKHIRLVVGAFKRDDEVQTPLTKETRASMPSLKILKPKKLSQHGSTVGLQYCGLELARYSGAEVLVEWKVVQPRVWKQQLDIVKYLALLLGNMDDGSFHSLRCMGYLSWEDRERYALVYELPSTFLASSLPPGFLRPSWQWRSLQELILDLQRVSLSRRYRIALDLAETMLQLHTAGWLHKGLRSENVMFISSAKSDPAALVYSQPYIVGYEYSRPDTSAAAALTELPDTALNADLYRHPDARGVHRQSYRKQFDMYALGCVLLELALEISGFS